MIAVGEDALGEQSEVFGLVDQQWKLSKKIPTRGIEPRAIA